MFGQLKATFVGCLFGALALSGCATPLIANIGHSAKYAYAADDAEALVLSPYLSTKLQVLTTAKLSEDGSQIVSYGGFDINPIFTDEATGLKMRGSRVKPGKYAIIKVLEGLNGVSSRFDCLTDKAVVFEVVPGRVNVFDGVDAIRSRAERGAGYDAAATEKTMADARAIVAAYKGIQAPVEIIGISGFVAIETRAPSTWDGKCNKFGAVRPWTAAGAK
jgi:hypothetical protein